MSLYGALFGAVSGLNAQSSEIGTISDNIANSNTIGYKSAASQFESLVINSSTAGAYQTGGVRANSKYTIDQQGLLQSTNSATDLAISGGGFFVVKGSATGTSAPVYTRAGSFTQDSLGNFVNGAGFYLQGWPLDRNGLLPGEPTNLNTTSFTDIDSLKTVNVQSASGVAQATTTISLGANLDATEAVFAGQAATVAPDGNVTNNANLPATAILVGSEYDLEGIKGDGIARGDTFVATTGLGLQATFEYGGFSVGRSVNIGGGSNNNGDGGINNTALRSTASGVVHDNGDGTLTLTLANNGMVTGDKITLANFSAVGDLTAVEINGTHTVTVSGNSVTITVAASSTNTPANVNQAGTTADLRQFSGTILNATSEAQTFLGTSSASSYTPAALTFTVTAAAAGGAKTFTYTTGSPNSLSGQFNSLDTLATAINSTTGLTARVVAGRLVVGSTDANDSVTFTNGDSVGTATAHGINWVGELDLANVAQDTANNRFSSLQGLAKIANNTSGFTATINNPLSAASLSLGITNPLDTVQFADASASASTIPTSGTPIAITNPGTITGTPTTPGTVKVTITATPPTGLVQGDKIYIQGLANALGGLPGVLPNGGPFTVSAVNGTTSYSIDIPVTQTVTVTGGPFAAAANNEVSVANSSNQGSLTSALGLTASLAGISYLTQGPQATAILPQKYDPTGVLGQNMASGDISAQFSRNVQIFDAQGTGHNIRFSFLKVATNTWAVEAAAIPPGDVTTGTGLVDGQIATGTVVFNGDGTLRSISQRLKQAVNVTWSKGASQSTVTLNLGTAGLLAGTPGATDIGAADGLSQFASNFNVNFANQNGAAVGQLVSVAIDTSGIVVASYSNGQTQKLFQLPLAEFQDPNGLLPETGNVFAETRESGAVNFRQAGQNGTGSVVASTLEQSNVDLATELTNMIVAQRAYQANTQVIKTADTLLDQLNQI